MPAKAVASNRSRLVTAAVAVALSVGLSYFVFKQLNLSDLSTLRKTSDLRFVALGFAAYTGVNVFRAQRFRALTGDRIPTRAFLRTVLLQNLFNTFLPMRAGEAVYLYMVHKSGAVRPGDNIGSLLGARLLDLLAALLIPALALPFSSANARAGIPLGWIAAAAALGLSCAGLGIRYAAALAGWIDVKLAQRAGRLGRVSGFAAEVLRSLAQLSQGKMLGRVALLTAGSWLLVYLSGYLSLRGVGLRLSIVDCVFAYSFPVLVSMMPFFMLGGFGVYEGSLRVALGFAGVPLGLATAASLALHITELLYVAAPFPITLIPRIWRAERLPT